MAAAGLGQTAAHHVADTQQHNVEPCPIGPEVVLMRVSGTDEERREQYADDRHHINDEFRCLESSFGFVATLGWHASGLSVDRAIGGRRGGTMCGGGIVGGHVVLLLTPVDVCRPGCDWGAALNRCMRKLLGRGRVSARALMRFGKPDAPGGTTRRTTAVDWLKDVRRRAEAHGISRSTTARTELIPVSGAPTPGTLPVSRPST